MKRIAKKKSGGRIQIKWRIQVYVNNIVSILKNQYLRQI